MHYHVIVFVPHSHTLPKPDERGWWKKGFTHIFAVRCFAAYLSKYLQKGMDGSVRFPWGLRVFGYGGLSFFEKAMWRCSWLSQRFWGKIYEAVGRRAFYVVRLAGKVVEVLTSSGERVIITGGGGCHVAGAGVAVFR